MATTKEREHDNNKKGREHDNNNKKGESMTTTKERENMTTTTKEREKHKIPGGGGLGEGTFPATHF